MHNNFQERIIAILRRSPNGLTSNEIAELVGLTANNTSSRLSKLAAYGIIDKVRHSRGPRASVYRALPDLSPDFHPGMDRADVQHRHSDASSNSR